MRYLPLCAVAALLATTTPVYATDVSCVRVTVTLRRYQPYVEVCPVLRAP
jgi:hypothetical protein